MSDGWGRAVYVLLRAKFESIQDSLQILALDVPADTEYAGIRAELVAAGNPIGPNDWFIAAHAYALEAVLVTANITDFSRIRALNVETWIAALHCPDAGQSPHSVRPAP